MTSKESAKRITITPLETVQASKLLEAHLALTGQKDAEGKELWQYDADWNDERVAAEVGGRIGQFHIRRLRLALGMHLQQAATTGGAATYRDPRVSLLIERFNALVDYVDCLPQSPRQDEDPHRPRFLLNYLRDLKISADDLRSTS